MSEIEHAAEEAAVCDRPHADEWLDLKVDPRQPLVIYAPGDGSLLYLWDDGQHTPWDGLSEIGRLLLATRLRYFADAIAPSVTPSTKGSA